MTKTSVSKWLKKKKRVELQMCSQYLRPTRTCGCCRAPPLCASQCRCPHRGLAPGCRSFVCAGSVRRRSWTSTGTRATSRTRHHSLCRANRTAHTLYKLAPWTGKSKKVSITRTWARFHVAVLVLHRGAHTGVGVGAALRAQAATLAGAKASRASLGAGRPRFPRSPVDALGLSEGPLTGLHQVINQR